MVTEARSHALLLAGCSVRSFCRCRGLFAALGKGRRGRSRGWMKGRMEGWMHGRMDEWVNRWREGQDKFTQGHVVVRFHKGELSWPITSSPAQQIRGEKNRMEKNGWMEGNESSLFSLTLKISSHHYGDPALLSHKDLIIRLLKPFSQWKSYQSRLLWFCLSLDEYQGRDGRPREERAGMRGGRFLGMGPRSCATSWALEPEVV